MNACILSIFLASITQQSCEAFSQITHTHTAPMQQRTNIDLLPPMKNTKHHHQSKSQLYMIGDFFNFDKKKGSEEESKKEDEVREEVISKKSEYVEDDPVEKLFNFFFGAKEENPMGLARFGAERFPGKMQYVFHYT